MTSIPASRRARATTFAPRSWPSRPGLATTIRIWSCIVVSPFPAAGSEGIGGHVRAPHVTKRVGHLADGGAGREGVLHRVQDVVGALGGLPQPGERLVHT